MILWVSVEDYYDMHVAGFSFRGAIELPFVERLPIEEGSSVVPCHSHEVFGGDFWT